MLRTLCTTEDLKNNYFPAECEHCGFQGCSGEWGGGHAIADTGDYTDPSCPKCGGLSCEEIENEQAEQDPRPYVRLVEKEDLIMTLENTNIDLRMRDKLDKKELLKFLEFRRKTRYFDENGNALSEEQILEKYNTCTHSY